MSELSWEVAHGFRVYTSESPFEHRRRRRRMLDWMVEMGAEKEAIKAATQRKKLAKEQAEKWPAAQVEAAKVGVSMAGWRALMVLIVAIFMGLSMTVVASSVLSSSPPMHASTASSTASGSETMCAKDASNPMKVITLPAISWTNLINDLTPSDAARYSLRNQVRIGLACRHNGYRHGRVQRECKQLHVRNNSASSDFRRALPREVTPPHA